jgi:predicted nuclease of predicted toxin-antitoxin system
MKLLLDENLPSRLKRDFLRHEVSTVRDNGWNGYKNGELLAAMISDNFDVLLTFDKNLQHQQNFEKYPIAVFVLTAESNQYKHLRLLVDLVIRELDNAKTGITIIG